MAVHVVFHVLSLPMHRSFRNSTETIGTRDSVLVELADGRIAWGEAAPFPGQDEAIEDLVAHARTGVLTPTAAAAVDEAVAVADGKVPRPVDPPPICLAIGLDDPVATVASAVRDGVGAFKLKVAPDAMRHVGTIRDAHPGVLLGVDGNSSFHAESADFAVWRDLGLSFAEELFADPELAASPHFRALGIPYFADESVRSVGDAIDALQHDHVDGVVVKPGRVGWSGAMTVVQHVRSVGKAWRASGLLETSIGRSFTNSLAGFADASVSDVAPASWFIEDVVDPNTGTALPPMVPDPDRLERWRVERFSVEVEPALSRPGDPDRG